MMNYYLICFYIILSYYRSYINYVITEVKILIKVKVKSHFTAY